MFLQYQWGVNLKGQKVKTSRRLWFGFLNEPNGDGSIVVFDKLYSSVNDEDILLCHYKRNEISIYKKEIVRSKLRPIDLEEQRLTFAVTDSYFETFSRFRRDKRQKERLSINYSFSDAEYEKEKQRLLDEVYEDAESWDRSNDEGWYYDKSEGDWLDNTADPNGTD